LLLKQWGVSHGDALYVLSQIPFSLSELISSDRKTNKIKSATGYIGSYSELRIIAVSDDGDNKVNVNNYEEINAVLDDFISFIDAQRENQAEY